MSRILDRPKARFTTVPRVFSWCTSMLPRMILRNTLYRRKVVTLRSLSMSILLLVTRVLILLVRRMRSSLISRSMTRVLTLLVRIRWRLLWLLLRNLRKLSIPLRRSLMSLRNPLRIMVLIRLVVLSRLVPRRRPVSTRWT